MKWDDKNTYGVTFRFAYYQFQSTVSKIRKYFGSKNVDIKIMWHCDFTRHLSNPQSPIYKYFKGLPADRFPLNIPRLAIRDAMRGGLYVVMNCIG